MKLFASLILGSLLAAPALAANEGAVTPGSMPVLNARGPAHHSRFFIGETTAKQGTARLTIPVDTPRDAFIVVFNKAPVSAKTVQGRALPGQSFASETLARMDVPSMGTRLDVSRLAPGPRQIQLSTEATGRIRYAVVQPNSPVDFTVQSRLAAHSGEPVVLTAQLGKGRASSAQITARVPRLGRVALNDAGRGADAAANDGVYSGRFIAPRVAERHMLRIRLDARGTLADGSPFRRTGTTAVMVDRQHAGLIGRPDAKHGELRLNLRGIPGRYRVEAVFGHGDTALAYSRQTVELGPVGRHHGRRLARRLLGMSHTRIALQRPAAAAAADHVVVRVLNKDTLGLESETDYPVEQLADYQPPAPGGAPSLAPALPASKARAAARFDNPPAE